MAMIGEIREEGYSFISKNVHLLWVNSMTIAVECSLQINIFLSFYDQGTHLSATIIIILCIL